MHTYTHTLTFTTAAVAPEAASDDHEDGVSGFRLCDCCLGNRLSDR